MKKYLRLWVLTAIVATTSHAAFLPVCERTPAVKTFLEQTVKKACADITAVDLLAVKRIAIGGRQIKEFKADDFTGLANLEILNIRSNPYTALPEGLLKDLVNLKTIVIISTSLRNYPDDFLEHNPLIENVHAFRNKVRSVSESILQRLENAKNLKAIDFDGTLLPAEKARLEKAFPQGGRVELALIGG